MLVQPPNGGNRASAVAEDASFVAEAYISQSRSSFERLTAMGGPPLPASFLTSDHHFSSAEKMEFTEEQFLGHF